MLYLDVLAHDAVWQLRLAPKAHRRSKSELKYWEIVGTENPPFALTEHLRFQSIGGTLILWNLLEKFVRGRATKEVGIERMYKKVLTASGITDEPRRSRMICEFNLLRHTRNSFHNGSVYDPEQPFRAELYGKTYVFTPGQEVTPIRLLDLAKMVWELYFEIVTNNAQRETFRVAGRRVLAWRLLPDSKLP